MKLSNGIQLNCESIRVPEPASDTVLIFLHEALGSIPQWRSFPAELCEKLKLNGLIFERQGHGKSDRLNEARNERYLHDYALKELPQVIQTLFPPGQKLILIGHSDGGTIALLYAASFPEYVEAVVTMAAHVINEPETIAGIQPAIDAYQAGKLKKLADFHGEKTDDLFYAWANTWKADIFRNWNICSDLKTLQSTVLALQGSNDQYGTIKQLELIKASVSGKCETAMISGCGHHPHLEKQKVVIDRIANFLTQQ
jgi:pimeloyl-ACP methyl ester carboxylesterase